MGPNQKSPGTGACFWALQVEPACRCQSFQGGHERMRKAARGGGRDRGRCETMAGHLYLDIRYAGKHFEGKQHVAGNLTRAEARERARLLDVDSYPGALDLTAADQTCTSV